MPVADENFSGRRPRAQGGDGFVGPVDDHGIDRGQPGIGQVSRAFGQGLHAFRQAREESAHFGEAVARQLDQVATAQQQAADEGLQRGVRRVSADHMKDAGRRKGFGPHHAVGNPLIQSPGGTQLGLDPCEQVRGRGGTKQRAERFRGVREGVGSFGRCHRPNHSSAAREQPRGRAAGSRPSSSNESSRLMARSCVRMPVTDPTLAAS